MAITRSTPSGGSIWLKGTKPTLEQVQASQGVTGALMPFSMPFAPALANAGQMALAAPGAPAFDPAMGALGLGASLLDIGMNLPFARAQERFNREAVKDQKNQLNRALEQVESGYDRNLGRMVGDDINTRKSRKADLIAQQGGSSSFQNQALRDFDEDSAFRRESLLRERVMQIQDIQEQQKHLRLMEKSRKSSRTHGVVKSIVGAAAAGLSAGFGGGMGLGG